MLSALKSRNFKIYWLGMVISLVGTWIQQVAQSWLVFQLTNSSFYLGLVGFFSSLPIFLFSLFGGIFADRYHKRNLLLITQSIFLVLAFVLGYLTAAGSVAVWHIILVALLNGVVMAFDAPTRQTIVIELVGKEHLMNAVALNSAAFNSARVIGPALTGILVGSIGMAGCFYINSFSFLAVIIALMFIRIDSKPVSQNISLIEYLRYTINFIKHNKPIRTLIFIICIPSLFGVSYIILMPIFANNILMVGLKGLGILMSCNGFGALFAALSLIGLGNFQFKGKLLVHSCLAFSIFLCLFGISTNFIFSCIILIFLGYTSVMAMALVNTLLQINADDEIRGRIISLFMIAFAGLVPFGNLWAGLAAEFVNARMTVFLGGVFCFLSFSVLIVRDRKIYWLR